MSKPHSWILTDVAANRYEPHFSIGSADAEIDLGTDLTWFIAKETLRGGLRDGVDVVRIDNGVLAFTVVPTRGMGIWQAQTRKSFVGWRAPVRGPVHPHYVDLQARGGLGWLTGFDELIVRCGLDWTGGPGADVALNNMGQPVNTPHTLHGRIANLPAHRVEVQVVPGDPPELVVIGEVDESALFLPQFTLRTRISTKLGSSSFTIEDEVVNRRPAPAELELLYHCNVGKPFLDAGSHLHVPTRLCAPRDPHAAEEIDRCTAYDGPTDGYIERCYWYAPLGDRQGDSLAMLRNRAGNRGFTVRFNVNELPCFTQWKNLGSEAEGYVTGLEPGTDYPNPKPFERQQGRVIGIPAKGSHRVRLTVEIQETAADVAAVEREIATLQAQAPCILHTEPDPSLTPR